MDTEGENVFGGITTSIPAPPPQPPATEAHNLSQLNELEREKVLFEKHKQKEEEKRKKQLLDKMNAERGMGRESRRNQLSPTPRDHSESSYSLSDDYDDEFTSNAKRRPKGRRRDDSDSDFEVVEQGGRKAASKPKKKLKTRTTATEFYDESKDREINMRDEKLVNKICLKRDFLIRMSSHLYFKKTVIGCLVKTTYKVSSNKIDYRIAEIKGVVEKEESYKVESKAGSKTLNKYLLVRMGNEEKELKFIFISNKEIDQRELYKWLEELKAFEMKKPTIEMIEEKYKQIKEILDSKYSASDIKKIVEIKVEQRYQSKFWRCLWGFLKGLCGLLMTFGGFFLWK